MYVCELTRRRYRGKKPKEIRGPDDVVALVGPKLRRERRENFVVLLLNARHEVMCVETVSVGSLNASIVHPREVFRSALVESAASILLVHTGTSTATARARSVADSRWPTTSTSATWTSCNSRRSSSSRPARTWPAR